MGVMGSDGLKLSSNQSSPHIDGPVQPESIYKVISLVPDLQRISLAIEPYIGSLTYEIAIMRGKAK